MSRFIGSSLFCFGSRIWVRIRHLILTNLTKMDLAEVHVAAPYLPPISSSGWGWTRPTFVSTGGCVGQMAQAMSAQLHSGSQRMGAKVRDGTVWLLTASWQMKALCTEPPGIERIWPKCTQNNMRQTRCRLTCEREDKVFKTEHSESKNVWLTGGKGQEVKHPHCACVRVSLCVFLKPEID